MPIHANFHEMNKDLIQKVFSKNHPFSLDELSEFAALINWDLVSANKNINWDCRFLETDLLIK